MKKTATVGHAGNPQVALFDQKVIYCHFKTQL